MFLGRVAKGDVFIEIACPLVDERRQPPLASGYSMHTL
jgi:hypothetical protein